ncbi:hypothetical protein [Xenorhabdus hominickii]|uniref:Uncharacterized protein n=1 Tax=Xenorhabdus hominickii TaxID=351679 RepID=A0A2G0PWB5_XENHO|nr:hypothetical protein [Xenorhabdus hominickii]AOM39198.1 hypothetical protein A9255_00340 [Xenorhabdus hominickii]PHM51245.1 hypothetical protein Xhom_04956 [Xenorhabdus hominickii]
MPSKKIIYSHTIDLDTLLQQLNKYPADTRVSFSGLDFLRVKQTGENIIQIEFAQSVYRTSEDVLVVQDHSK